MNRNGLKQFAALPVHLLLISSSMLSLIYCRSLFSLLIEAKWPPMHYRLIHYRHNNVLSHLLSILYPGLPLINFKSIDLVLQNCGDYQRLDDQQRGLEFIQRYSTLSHLYLPPPGLSFDQLSQLIWS